MSPLRSVGGTQHPPCGARRDFGTDWCIFLGNTKMGDLRQQFETGTLPLVVGALTTLNLISQALKIDGTRLQGYRLAKMRIAVQLEGKTATEGPLIWGFSANMTEAQTELALESDPQGKARDIARGDGSWIKIMGLIPVAFTVGPLTGAGGGTSQTLVAELIDVKVNWSITEGNDFRIWVYNMDTSTITTGTILTLVGEFFGVWLND